MDYRLLIYNHQEAQEERGGLPSPKKRTVRGNRKKNRNIEVWKNVVVIFIYLWQLQGRHKEDSA